MALTAYSGAIPPEGWQASLRREGVGHLDRVAPSAEGKKWGEEDTQELLPF